MKIKALTLHQPWASLMAWGIKRYETRSWRTSHTGLLAIHAAKEIHDHAYNTVSDNALLAEALEKNFSHDLNQAVSVLDILPVGCILSLHNLIDCNSTELMRDDLKDLERALGNFDDDRFAWQCQIITSFPDPIQAKGKQDLWDWELPDDIKLNYYSDRWLEGHPNSYWYKSRGQEPFSEFRTPIDFNPATGRYNKS